MNIKTLGIDLAKNIFQLHGVDSNGKVILKKRLKRNQLDSFIANLSVCTIVMEACGGANFWCRRFSRHGHTVKLISPQYVKPFVKTNKNDQNDAEAIVEASSRPSMYFVSSKTIEHQDIQAIHRLRSRCIAHRTATVNQVRGLLTEYGVIIPKGISHARKQLPLILEDAENELTELSRTLFSELYDEICHLDERITSYDRKLLCIFQTNEDCRHLETIPGVGIISATALIAAVGDANVFKNGRQMSAWLGLVPRQCSSGGRQKLLGISKRGDCYLRKLLVHGARSVVYRAKYKIDQKSEWLNKLSSRKGTHLASVALANRIVRAAWSILIKKESYKVSIS